MEVLNEERVSWEKMHADEVIDFLWKNRKKILDEKLYPDGFEFPDYGGLPKKTSNKLSGDFVDAIQAAFYELRENDKTTKPQFAKMCKEYM